MTLSGNKPELRVALGYLRLAAGRLDMPLARKVLSMQRGISAGTIKKVAEAVDGSRPLMDVLHDPEALGVSAQARAGIEAFLAFGEQLAALRSEGPRAVVQAAIDLSGYGAEIRSEDGGGTARLENLEKLADAVDGFESLESLLDEMDRQSEVDDLPKPKTASLFQTMTLERITFEDAMQLLSLPRLVGTDPADGLEITVQNGRFGPYLKKGSDSRSLDKEEQLLTITLEECLEVLAQPKRRGRNTPKPPLRELGVDPESGKTMVLKDGNWGPYVTDGEYNASLKRGDSVEELSDERAAELLAERRMKGPAKKRR